jgi:enolase-phosphatase E1
LLNKSIKAVLLDIEGTTTPIDYVYETLFPYAREKMQSFVREHRADLEEDLDALVGEMDADVLLPSSRLSQIQYLIKLMDEDRKSTSLKNIQGKIWQSGFASGELRSLLFPDVKPALERWVQEGRKVYIFSSGSVLAQELIFRYSNEGDLTKLVSGYFDTTTGAKREPSSYQSIAASIGHPPEEIAFISDVVQELTAAQDSGMHPYLALRPGNRPADTWSGETVNDFSEL